MDGIDLYCGDCLEILKTLPADSIDVVITDPPYGTGKYKTDKTISCQLYRAWIETYQVVAIFGYPELLCKWCIEIGRAPDEWITWWPTNRMAANSASLPKESEAIAIWGKPPGAHRLIRPRALHSWGQYLATLRGLSPYVARLGDVWRDASPGQMFNYWQRQHPNEKPISLMRNLVELCSAPGDLILDPFMGSGTTGVACIELGRRFVGIEIDPMFFAVAQKRIVMAWDGKQMNPPLMEVGT